MSLSQIFSKIIIIFNPLKIAYFALMSQAIARIQFDTYD